MPTRSVITFAFGNDYYLRLAVNLARSFLYWHPDNEIEFCLITDRPAGVPPDVARRIRIRDLRSELVGRGFYFKLRLDDFLITDQTLYIDSDCLCFGHLGRVFERFEGTSVGVIGSPIGDGDYWGDVRRRCDAFGLSSVPEQMAALYYLERDSAAPVLETARKLAQQYEALGMLSLRGGVNDEPLVSMSIAIHGLDYLPEDGQVKADIGMYGKVSKLNVLNGDAVLYNAGRLRWDGRPYPHQLATPLIVHYYSSYSEQWYYKGNAFALRLIHVAGWPRWLCTSLANLAYVFPGRSATWVKDVLRPAYRRLFGTRMVRPIARVKGGDPLIPMTADTA